MSMGILYHLYISGLSKPEVISFNLAQITKSLKLQACMVRNIQFPYLAICTAMKVSFRMRKQPCKNMVTWEIFFDMNRSIKSMGLLMWTEIGVKKHWCWKCSLLYVLSFVWISKRVHYVEYYALISVCSPYFTLLPIKNSMLCHILTHFLNLLK